MVIPWDESQGLTWSIHHCFQLDRCKMTQGKVSIGQYYLVRFGQYYCICLYSLAKLRVIS